MNLARERQTRAPAEAEDPSSSVTLMLGEAMGAYPLHDPRIDVVICAQHTAVHGRHDGGVVGACIGMARERKELDGVL
jgi:hypothetical protein